MKSRNKAFTLIELLVVIAIIGILAGVVLASLNSARAKARDARRVSDIRAVQNALELYYLDNGVYPASPDILFPGLLQTTLVPNYISTIPSDPSLTNYRYYTNNTDSYYVIRVLFETKPNCWYAGGIVPTSNFWSLPQCSS